MSTAGTWYVTRQQDMVDLICKRFYGTEHGTTEMVITANPGLAAMGPVLDSGIHIFLPELAPPPKVQPAKIKLWG